MENKFNIENETRRVEDTRSDYPPPYTAESSGPPTGPQPGPPPRAYYHGATVITQAPTYIHTATPIGVVGTNVGVVGTNVSFVGTNVSVVGTNTGYVGPMGQVVVAQQWAPKAMSITCQSCQQEIVTRVEPKNTFKTHFIAAVLCLMGCWCCVCIPYCTDSCKNVDHYCPNCNAYIGGYFI